MWDSIPVGQGKNIFIRCCQSPLVAFIESWVVYYISLVYQSIASNFTPIFTMFLSYFMTGEKITKIDLSFVLFSLIGVTMTTIGLKEEDNKTDSGKSEKSNMKMTAAIIAVISIPLIKGSGQIVLRRMKGLNTNTATCYTNVAITLFCSTIIICKGDTPLLQEVLSQCKFIDWILFALSGVAVIYLQTFRYLALQYDEPGKLTQYVYLLSLFHLVYDVFIFDKRYTSLQWTGFSILFLAYILKFLQMYITRGDSSDEIEPNIELQNTKSD